MSFILDALRKAENKNRDRHNMTVPTGPRVLTEELPEATVERRSWVWVAILAVLAVGLLWWFFPAKTSTVPPGNGSQIADIQNTQPPAAAPRELQPPIQSNERPAERPNVQRETGARSLDREVRRGLAPGVASNPTAQNTSAGSLAPSSTMAPSRRITPGTVRILEPDGSLPVTAPANTPSKTPAITSGRVEVEALPEYRSSLANGDVPIPQLHLDMHVFSAQPAKRFVFINLDKYAEGDAIDSDTTVESIEPQGAVINHKGYRFVLRPE